MHFVTVDYRLLTLDDYEQAADLEASAFYNPLDTENRAREMREVFKPEWTLGAFLDGKLVADVRTIPMVRRFHGATMKFGAVGPVACLAPYRRRGFVARLLTMSLELMRQREQVLSGLHTPHDALYQRFGWERAEAKVYYSFAPKDIQLRSRSLGGRAEPANPHDWEALDATFKAATANRNGPFVRSRRWWENSVLKSWLAGKRIDADIVRWVGDDGVDEGYIVYLHRSMPSEDRWESEGIFIRDMVALTSNAYLGLWAHMLTHDLADKIEGEFHPDDRFRQQVENPFKVKAEVGSGAMLRVVDVERAFSQRPFSGVRPAVFTLHVEDPNLAWNSGAWRVEAAEGKMLAERTEASPDAEMSANILASLFSGYMKPRVAFTAGFARLHNPDALAGIEQAFAVLDAPYCPDYY